MDNLGVSPSKFTDYGIISKETAEVTETLVTTYGDDVVTALDNGIEPTLIKSLDDLQITPAEFTQYKITSKTAAEATENAINQGSVKTWKAFFADNVGKYGFETAKEASDDYLELLTGESPWPKGEVQTLKTFQPGDTYYMVVDDTQFEVSTNTIISLGSFGTFDEVVDMDFFRNNLAVKEAWKSSSKDLYVLELKIKDGIDSFQLPFGTVGPQIDFDPVNGIDRYLPGGASQFKFDYGTAFNVSELVSYVKLN